MGLGFQLVAAIVVFGALGFWLDGRFGTKPWLMVVGLILGAVGGMIGFIRTALKSGKENRE
jgi:F0F1-type ATP synthase assembly protein I